MKLRREFYFTTTALLFHPWDWLVRVKRVGTFPLACTLVLLLWSVPAGADPITGYTLEIVAQRGDVIGGKTLTSLGAVYSLNNSGTVLFTGCFSDGCGRFTQSELVVSGGVTIDGKTLTGGFDAALNDSGTVAFHASFSGGAGIFTESELLFGSGDTIGGKTLTGFPTGLISLNDFGTVNKVGYFYLRNGE